MPWQLEIRRKDGKTIQADLGFARTPSQRPNIGDVLNYTPDMISVKVIAIRATQVGAAIGQPLEVVCAEEI